MEYKKLEELNFHETVVIKDSIMFVTCMRVHGGYIYEFMDKQNNIYSTQFIEKTITTDKYEFKIHDKHEGLKRSE